MPEEFYREGVTTTMGTVVEYTPDQTMSKVKDFADAALQAVTSEMVTETATKLVKMVEFADDVIQPETLELLKVLPDVSKSLEHALLEVKKLEENGTLNTLFQVLSMIQSMKSALTGPMVTDLMDKAVKGVEVADEMLQKGSLDLVDGMVTAFQEAKYDRQEQEPMSMFQLLRTLSDKETRQGMSLLLAFVQKLPKQIL
jgi:uncharacterized protein YjgD (DUF1641 family)